VLVGGRPQVTNLWFRVAWILSKVVDPV